MTKYDLIEALKEVYKAAQDARSCPDYFIVDLEAFRPLLKRDLGWDDQTIDDWYESLDKD